MTEVASPVSCLPTYGTGGYFDAHFEPLASILFTDRVLMILPTS